MSIGIYGGTFDPIHVGHLVIAEYIRDYFDFSQIVFVPSGNPPFKYNLLTDASDRLSMVKLAISENPYFKCSDFEIQSPFKSYTIKTVDYMKKLYHGEDMFFIVGQDAAFDIDKWYKYDKLVDMITFVVAQRGDDIKNDILRKNKAHTDRFIFIETPFIEISSSDIRDRIVHDKSVRYMLSEKVLDYIEKKGLYRK